MMSQSEIKIRNARPEEFQIIGDLMVKVYAQLEGFPTQSEQPAYYSKLSNVGKLTEEEETALIIATSEKNNILGAVVYFSDMKNYGSGGIATEIKNASGFRLLAVDPIARGKGIGKLLCLECINRTKKRNQKQLLIHTTESMKVAWGMYERLGFERCKEIDFIQGKLPVFGFKLKM